MNPLDLFAAVVLLAGSTLALLAAIGLHRLPDLYARMHAATKPVTLGVLFCLTAAAIRTAEWSTATTLALAVVLQFLTAPVAAHLLGRAAHRHHVDQSPHTVLDETD